MERLKQEKKYYQTVFISNSNSNDDVKWYFNGAFLGSPEIAVDPRFDCLREGCRFSGFSTSFVINMIPDSQKNRSILHDAGFVAEGFL